MGLADITPSGVRKAYLEKRWKPQRYTFGSETEKRGCALSVLYGPHAVLRAFEASEPIPASEMEGVPIQSVWVFAWGFDGVRLPAPYEMFRSEYELGRACWEAVKDLAVKEVGV